MTFLSKLGKVLATIVNIAGIAAGIGPILGSFLGSKVQAGVATVAGKIVNDLTAVGQTVLMAETMIQGTGTGAMKLAAATPLVAQIIQTSELVAGHKIANEALFIQGSQKVTSGVADILNALHPDAIPSPGPTPVVAPLPTLPTPAVPPAA